MQDSLRCPDEIQILPCFLAFFSLLQMSYFPEMSRIEKKTLVKVICHTGHVLGTIAPLQHVKYVC